MIPQLLAYLRDMLPADALSLLEKYLQQVVEGSRGSLLSLGLLGALWASSSGMTAVMDALTVVYDTKETRTVWKIRVTAIAMTIGLAGFIILSTSLVLASEHIAEGWRISWDWASSSPFGWMIVHAPNGIEGLLQPSG